MRKIVFILSVIIIAAIMTGVYVYAQSQTLAKGSTMNKKILIAYYSKSGNTREIAREIQSQTGAEMFEIIPLNPYPAIYNDAVERAKKEKETDFKPPLKNYIDIEQYDVIFVGTPIWWYTMSSPVKTFMTENNFENKIIVPFCTHGGGGASSAFIDMQKLAPKAQVLEGFEVYSRGNMNTSKDIANWLKRVKVL